MILVIQGLKNNFYGNGRVKVQLKGDDNANYTPDLFKLFNKKSLLQDGSINITNYSSLVIDIIKKECKGRYTTELKIITL